MKEKMIRILIIEDNPGDVRIILEMLREQNTIRWEYDTAESVGEALNMLSNASYNIILMDLKLPDSEGLETFQTIVARIPEIPIIVMTGLDDEERATTAVREGAQDYLVKGRVDGDILIKSICYAIERKFIQEELKRHKMNLEEVVEERTGELLIINRQLSQEIKERKAVEETLKKREKELERYSKNLEEANTAMKVLLKIREEDKVKLEQDVLSNVKEIVLPVIEKLKQSNLGDQQLSYLATIEHNLNTIISPFLRNLTIHHYNLTPREIQIANFVKEGKTTKEIAELINLSTKSVDFHRNNIRIKLNIKNKKANLRSVLLSLS